MDFLFDNQNIIATYGKANVVFETDKPYGKVAFAYENGKDEDPAEEIVLLHKIIAATGQTVDNSLIIKLDNADFSHHVLASRGIQSLICFSNYRLKKWEAVNYQINRPFFVQELQIFQTCALSHLANSADMKTKLWAFLKQAAI